jgi:hypothetical protein
MFHYPPATTASDGSENTTAALAQTLSSHSSQQSKKIVAVNNSLITYSTKGQEIWLSPFLSHKLTINQRIIYS